MRLVADDGSYGVVIWPYGAGYSAQFFGFQLIVAGQLIGDAEPSVVWSAVDALFRLPELFDSRLRSADEDPELALDAVLNDERLNSALYCGCESLDSHLTAAYVDRGRAVWLSQRVTQAGERTDRVAVASIAIDEYSELVHRVRDFHQRETAAR